MSKKFKISRIDELMGRKMYLERVLSISKKEVGDKIALMMASALDDNVEKKISGQIIMIERWIADIEVEISGLMDFS